MSKLADLVSGRSQADQTPTGQLRQLHLARFEEHMRSPSMRAVFEAYHCATGEREVPVIIPENQADGGKSAWQRNEMTALCNGYVSIMRAINEERRTADPAHPTQIIQFGQKKYMVPHTGENGGQREDNKRVSEAVAASLVQHYEATPIGRFMDDLKERKLNQHDVADALLLALEKGMSIYKALAKTVLPRRRRGEKRSAAPVLTPGQMGDGGTIRVLGIDPGTTNLGLCLIELVAQQLPPPDAGDEPEPLFRVLAMQLVNLNQDPLFRRFKDNWAIASLGAPTGILAPAYDTADIRSFFARAEQARQASKKRKRTESKEKPAKKARVIDLTASQ